MTEGDRIRRLYDEAQARGDTKGMAAARDAMRAYVDRLVAKRVERDLVELRAWTAGTTGYWGDPETGHWIELGPPDLGPPAA